MSQADFIISVYCLVEEVLSKFLTSALRTRGFPPKLTDAEAITMELVGEFLGYDTDKGIWEYFKTHWHDWFPNLGSRSNFAKQISNLWCVKQFMHEVLLNMLHATDDAVSIIDGFPIPVCHYARSRRHNSFKTKASYGFCAAKQEKYFGFKGNLLINLSGVITGITVTAANVDERHSMFDVIANVKNVLIGDMGFIGLELQEKLKQYGIRLETPKRKNMNDDRDPLFIKEMKSIRRLVETVINQLKERFSIAKVWARDTWHLTNRITRKVLSHTIAVVINHSTGRKPIQFDGLLLHES